LQEEDISEIDEAQAMAKQRLKAKRKARKRNKKATQPKPAEAQQEETQTDFHLRISPFLEFEPLNHQIHNSSVKDQFIMGQVTSFLDDRYT